MADVEFDFPLSAFTSLPNGKTPNLTTLTTAVQASTIVTALDFITYGVTAVQQTSFFFKAALSAGDQTTLNAIVAAHTGAQSPGQITAVGNDPAGNAPTGNPVLVGSWDGTKVRYLHGDTFGNPVFTSFEIAAALGILAGAIASRAVGYVATSSTGNQAVRGTPYLPQGNNAQRSVSSTSAADANGGTGAQSVTINYLDAAFAAHSETVVLNGVTPVNTVGTNIAFIESIVVASVGSGQVNAGTIQLFTATGGGGTIWASAAPGDQGTAYAHHYVPAGVTCYVTSLIAGGTVVSGVSNLVHQQSLKTAGAPTVQAGESIVHPAAGQWDHDFRVPVAFTGPDLIWVNEQPTAATANKTWAGFEYVQF